MKLENRPQTRQTQKQQLSITTDMLQSLGILRMPLVDLRELVMESIAQNPLLDMEAPPPDDTTAPAEYTPAPPPSGLADPEDERFAARDAVDYSVRDIWHQSGQGNPGDIEAISDGHGQTFVEMLQEQLGTMPLEAEFADLCTYLVECLNPRGYLDISPGEIAAETGASLDDVMQALYLVQSLQPCGVGARSLSECLVLQLVNGSHFNAHTIRLVKDGLPLLAENDYAAIARLLGCDAATARQCADIVRGLEPIPSRGYDTGESVQAIIPDAVVTRDENGFSVVLNSPILPRLSVSREYQDILATTQDPEVKSYISENLADARTLIRSVEGRQSTLARIIDVVIGEQAEFFAAGRGLRPMTMQWLAEKLALHTSTVSRAVQGKYIICAAGTVELRKLFSAAVSGNAGEELSPAFIKERLAACIAAEDPKAPLSDEGLREALEALGIRIARRTVAKYREELGYASSSARKRFLG